MARNINNRRAVTTDVGWWVPVALMIAVMTSSTVMADEWNIRADLFTALTFSDNVFLTSPGKEDEFIWELTPGIVASRAGKRVDIAFDYRLQGLLFAREDRRNEVYNFLETRLNAEVIPDFLRFDAIANISQTVIDPLIAASRSSISVSGNSAEQMTVTVSPYIERTLTPTTVLRAGVLAALIEFDEARLVDNKQRDYFASVVNQSKGGLFSWSMDYRSTLVEYDIGQEIELARATAELGVRLAPRTEFVVSGGEDFNEFGDLVGAGAAEGTFWNAGFRGGFGKNITFDIRAGEQFFGESYSLTFRRATPGITTGIGYTESATTVGAQQLTASNAQTVLNFSENFFNDLDADGFALPTRDPELYIRRRLDFTNSVQSGKSTITARVFYEDRQFIRTSLEGARENVRGASAEWSWAYNSFTTFETRGTYQLFDSRDTVSRPEDLRIDFLARRAILSSSFIQAVLSHNSRSAPAAADEYDELSLRVGFGRSF